MKTIIQDNLNHKKKVYFAGPDVFEPDAVLLGKRYVKEAKKRDLIGLYPLDNKVSFSQEKPDIEIFKLNRELLDICDYVVANLNDFRGHEPDSGTVWEVAYAFAKGKTVIGYVNKNESILDRISQREGVQKEGDIYMDKQGRHIENFGNPLNLMLQHSISGIVFGNVEDALNEVQKRVSFKNNLENNTKLKVNLY